MKLKYLSMLPYLHLTLLTCRTNYLAFTVNKPVSQTSISSHVLASSVANMVYPFAFQAANLIDRLVAACESIVEPMSTNSWPDKEMYRFYWSRHVSVVSSRKRGEGILCSAHCTLYNGSLFIRRQNQFRHRLLTCC